MVFSIHKSRMHPNTRIGGIVRSESIVLSATLLDASSASCR